MPSWGSLLKELEGLVSVGEEPWKFVPLILLVVVVTLFQSLLSRQPRRLPFEAPLTKFAAQ